MGREDPLEKEMATHSSIAWKIPWTEEPGGLQTMGSQRVGHDQETKHKVVLGTKQRDFLLNASLEKTGLMCCELAFKLKSTSGIPGPPKKLVWTFQPQVTSPKTDSGSGWILEPVDLILSRF